MPKPQKSFADKARKAAEKKAGNRYVRVIRSTRDPETDVVRFLDRMEMVPGDANLDDHLRKVVEQAE